MNKKTVMSQKDYDELVFLLRRDWFDLCRNKDKKTTILRLVKVLK